MRVTTAILKTYARPRALPTTAAVWEECSACGDLIVPRQTPSRVIVNVYRRGRWTATKLFHPACYVTAGQPHGSAERAAATPARGS